MNYLLFYSFISMLLFFNFFFFFFTDTATTEIYTLSLHDALPILQRDVADINPDDSAAAEMTRLSVEPVDGDRKSTRLNSSHTVISYAVFCLKKKKKNRKITTHKLKI